MRTEEATRPKDCGVERLREDERALVAALAAARRDAAERVDGARREAEAIVAEARRALAAEVARVRDVAAAERERERAAARESDAEAIAELARRAEANRSRAVVRALAVVLDGVEGGGAPP